jgi:ethanolamine utilization protein EutN
MRVAEVIGTVTLSRWHPALTGARYVLAVPMMIEGLKGQSAGRTEPISVYDDIGAGGGALIAVSEGTEAAAPFYPAQKPVDAYNAAILDTLELDPKI